MNVLTIFLIFMAVSVTGSVLYFLNCLKNAFETNSEKLESIGEKLDLLGRGIHGIMVVQGNPELDTERFKEAIEENGGPFEDFVKD
ncbi:hypothetical protein AKJ51_02985 [candidate division MSBL1 archaeon SCGC-AAA382A20]|uniref:Uncharacterized protein n=1 Tax=candidate division MSBL1 archaeon SCGC-AAA382A20 TaxID=1698280 RepID=A0A133VJX4_9EURY|nr:hypothetical protein AKJ51_02985 [candidate division MSBL1 archaeon SCGC-AAA382A20]